MGSPPLTLFVVPGSTDRSGWSETVDPGVLGGAGITTFINCETRL